MTHRITFPNDISHSGLQSRMATRTTAGPPSRPESRLPSNRGGMRGSLPRNGRVLDLTEGRARAAMADHVTGRFEGAVRRATKGNASKCSSFKRRPGKGSSCSPPRQATRKGSPLRVFNVERSPRVRWRSHSNEACVAAKAANADGADDSGKPFLTSLQVCDILVVQG